jgi:hypothetical protein
MVLRIVIVVLVVTEAGFMLFDGVHAFVKGDYVTPKSGEYAGKLGPWHHLVSAVGIGPRSNLMKAIFVAYGAIWLVIAGFYAGGAPWAWTAMLVAAIGSLWYLMVGTATSVLIILLLLVAHWTR